MSCSNVSQDGRTSKEIIIITVQTASYVIINTIARNIIKIYNNADVFNNIVFNEIFDDAVGYVDRLKKSTILFLLNIRSFSDFFDTLKQLAYEVKESEGTVDILYPILEEKIKNKLFEKGGIQNRDPYLLHPMEEHCSYCKMEILAEIKIIDGFLENDSELDVEKWIEVLSENTNFAKKRCTCSHFDKCVNS